MQENSKQNYLHGAAIMAAGVVVTKILGAIYKIPLGNILGDEGYGYFSVAYNIYYVFLTMATAGMPVALSRMISEADTLSRPMQARKIFRVAWLTFAIFGILLGLVMFLFPTELAGMLNNVRAAQSIWALSPALVLVYLTSTYRRQVLYEMIYNLCDNAIKYNRRDGEVEVTVSRGRNGRASS